jgi:NAD(P)-dependent dehydrogenase (short-subunit alcohol dehydrogenase family)
MDLSRKSVVVTGAASGIGAAIAELFLESGAKVVAVDWSAELKSLSDRVPAESRERLRLVTGDVSRDQTAREYVRTALDGNGTV